MMAFFAFGAEEGSAAEDALLPLTTALREEAPRGFVLALERCHQALSRHTLMWVLNLDSEEQLEGLQSQRAQRTVTQLRRYMYAAVSSALLASFASVALLVRGLEALQASRPVECKGPLREWLQSYLFLQVGGFWSIPVTLALRRLLPQTGQAMTHFLGPGAVLMLVWCIGAVAYLRAPDNCPALHGMTYEALSLQIIIVLLFIVAGLHYLAAQPLIARTNDFASRAFLLSEAAMLVAEVPVDEAPSGEECVICLGCLEEQTKPPSAVAEQQAAMSPQCADCGAASDLEKGGGCGNGKLDERPSCAAPSAYQCIRPKWRQLRCGHKFHEECLFAWLRKAKRCPMCRRHVKESMSRRKQQRRPAVVSAGGARSREDGGDALGSTTAAARGTQADVAADTTVAAGDETAEQSANDNDEGTAGETELAAHEDHAAAGRSLDAADSSHDCGSALEARGGLASLSARARTASSASSASTAASDSQPAASRSSSDAR
eukprot:TRINITY_DN24173_c0_g1_i1.p1 TRINITY_DN24173_c0_g1~~TRINITY_DN24173_c0_g1_i1.p1  ORF type:complete len:491 (-),score=117.57 TRINITY_DN24173_c0_g1_i1:144-1616(-)